MGNKGKPIASMTLGGSSSGLSEGAEMCQDRQAKVISPAQPAPQFVTLGLETRRCHEIQDFGPREDRDGRGAMTCATNLDRPPVYALEEEVCAGLVRGGEQFRR